MLQKICFLAMTMLIGLALSATDELKILTIGNSFSNSVFSYLPKIAESANCKIKLEHASLGGCPLEKHWKLVEKSEADPTLKSYTGMDKNKYNLKELLEQDKWDIVTVQQASDKSWKAETYEPYLTNLIEYIHKYAPTAEIVIQQTWAYRVDSPRLINGWKITQQEMYESLTQAYRKAATDHGLRIIPSGYGVQLGREKQAVKFQPAENPTELPNLTYPEKPPVETGSWATGTYWKKDQDGTFKLKKDPNHLNSRGRYLQSCIWFAFLYNHPTSEIKFAPEDVTPEDAQFIRDIAQEAVNNFEQVGKK